MNNNYRKVLVAFDGSSSSRNALRQSFLMGTWIKVLAVVPDYVGDIDLTGVSRISEITHGLGQKLLTEAMAIALEEKMPILTNLEQGEPYERIVQVADDEHCDLIAMGRKGMTKLERALMGEVTARVIGYTTKDVLVVPERGSVHLHEMLLATDGSPNTAKAVRRALCIAKQYKARLTLVSVVYTNNELLAQAPQAITNLIRNAHVMLEGIKDQADKEGIETRLIVKEGDPHVAISALAAEMGEGLIVMGSHGRRGLTRLLMGSVAEQVIGSSVIPVLVCHSQS